MLLLQAANAGSGTIFRNLNFIWKLVIITVWQIKIPFQFNLYSMIQEK
jgi:hypothetical protein